MIATEQSESNEQVKPRPPARTGTWDADGFAEQAHDAHWDKMNDVDEKKTATRLQDLSLGVDDDPEAVKQQRLAKQNQTWPFEEPCAWHGAKNTRPTAEAENINKQYFNPDFKPDGQKMDFEDIESEKSDRKLRTAAAASAGTSNDNASTSSSSSSDSSTETGESSEDSESDDSDSDGDSFCVDDDDDDAVQVTKLPSQYQGPPSQQPNRGGPSAGTSNSNHSRSGSGSGLDRSGSNLARRTSRSSVEDDNAEAMDASDRSSSSNRASQRQSSLGKADAASSRTSAGGYNNMLAWNKGNSDQSMEEGPSDGRTSSSSGRRERTTERRGSLGRSSSSSRTSTRRADDLSASCHGSLQTAQVASTRASTSSRSSANQSLESTTYHGSGTGAAATGRSTSLKTSSSSRAAPPSRKQGVHRTKSSDGTELVSSNTMHGTGTGAASRNVRGGKRRPSKTLSSTKPPGERRMLKRAMSTRNVKRPEEYGPAAVAGAGVGGPGQPSVPARSGMERSVSDDGTGAMRGQESRRASTRPASRSSALQRSTSQRGGMRDTGPSATRPGPSSTMQRAQSQRHMVSEGTGSASSSDHSKGAAAESAGARRGIRRGSSRRQVQAPEAPPPRRDLLVLLREQRKVTEQDLLDKENRRLLHFLMYEHKMGIPLKELHKVIQMEEDGMAV